MPDDSTVRASLAYRKGRPDIWAGRVPAKYTRLLPHITGPRVLELGSAEGVLSLLMSREHVADRITALEMRDDRHDEGERLRDRWANLGYDVSRVRMVWGNILDRLDLLAEADCLVAVRSIYYLREAAPVVLREAARSVARVVLCGNGGRQRQYRREPDSELGRFNRLSSVEGMRALLEDAGYGIETVLDEGDPIVVGRHPRFA